MNKNFRRLALEKIAGELVNAVKRSVDNLGKKPNFVALGSAGAGTTVWMPEDVVKSDGTFDMAINFRGIVGTKEGVGKLGLSRAVIVTAEAVGPQSENMGSKLLVQQFANPARINNIISIVTNHLKKQFPEKANIIHLGKLILSGFSGGGAVVNYLAPRLGEINGDVAGIFINDGLHSMDMDALAEFAEKARKDPKHYRFGIVHTAVVPAGGYPSTTATADDLRYRLGLSKEVPEDTNQSVHMPYVSRDGGVEIATMFDKVVPYFADNRVGSMGHQHIKAMEDGFPYLFRDVQDFLDKTPRDYSGEDYGSERTEQLV